MNTQNNIHATVTKYLADHVITQMAVRYDQLANRVFSKRAYQIESEMTAIASEVGSHARIPQDQIEGFLVALAKANRPAVKLELPKFEKLARPTAWRPGTGSYALAVKTEKLADWSPSCK